MISSVLFAALALGIVVLLVTAALSPVETLSWWAGWTEEELDTEPPAPKPEGREADRYIVYLAGVASLSGEFLLPRERAFIRKLRKRFPKAAVITDVFPYSPRGLPLLAPPRIFERLWRKAQALKLYERQTLLSVLINTRNIFQVMVSADRRYGPIFNQGAAKVIEDALMHDGYHRGGGAPVSIIGYSGGAQVAVGAAAFLKARLGVAVDVISIGGVIASDPGLNYVGKLYHVVGDRDFIRKLGSILFPERWRMMALSDWNAAKRNGVIETHKLSHMTHAGVKGYFGRPPVDGVSNAERTLDTIAGMIERNQTPG